MFFICAKGWDFIEMLNACLQNQDSLDSLNLTTERLGESLNSVDLNPTCQH